MNYHQIIIEINRFIGILRDKIFCTAADKVSFDFHKGIVVNELNKLVDDIGAYLEIAKKTNKKICVITDNDGKQNRIAEATTFNKTNTLQHIFLGTTTDDWTWEACLYNLNKTALDGMIEVQAGADYLFHKKDYGQVLGKMLNNKVETAYKMLLSKMAFVVPQYIKDAIKWLRE